MATEGTDFSGSTDLDSALREAPTARHALVDAIVRRLTTRNGALVDFPAYGFDLRTLIGSTVSETAVKQKIIAQCLDEEECEGATVTISKTVDTVTIVVSIEDGDGPFDLTLDVSALEVSAVFPQG